MILYQAPYPDFCEINKSDVPTYSKIFSDTICELGKKDNTVAAITAAMPDGVGLTKFSKWFPDRFFDVGIAEAHAVTFAAGLAAGGLKPVFAVYSSFLQRAYDQILHDVCIQQLHVVFAIDRAGLVGSDGETHQGIFDISFLSSIPNMTICAPKNDTVGLFSDMLVSKGGTTILTEVPEMFGAETILMNRCANKELFEKTVHLINDFKEYFIKNGQEIYENPSPGNKDGGITTLEDKSLGCTQKSGSSLVKGVLAYGERVSDKGLNLLSAPGNDLVASTACAAAGAQMVLFTTGRGTPFASPVPTVKIATNSRLAGNKSNWIDFNAGRIVTDDLPLEDAAKELFQLVLDVASGKKVKAEIAGFHDLAIFKQGVTL